MVLFFSHKCVSLNIWEKAGHLIFMTVVCGVHVVKAPKGMHLEMMF